MEAQQPVIFRSAAEVIGCLIAPTPIIAIGVVESIFYPSFDAVAGIVLALVVYMVALGFTLLLGYPLYRLAVRLNVFRWWTSMLAGSFVGVLVTMLLSHPTDILDGDIPRNALAAAISGLLFWIVQRWAAVRGHSHGEEWPNADSSKSR